MAEAVSWSAERVRGVYPTSSSISGNPTTVRLHGESRSPNTAEEAQSNMSRQRTKGSSSIHPASPLCTMYIGMPKCCGYGKPFDKSDSLASSLYVDMGCGAFHESWIFMITESCLTHALIWTKIMQLTSSNYLLGVPGELEVRNSASQMHKGLPLHSVASGVSQLPEYVWWLPVFITELPDYGWRRMAGHPDQRMQRVAQFMYRSIKPPCCNLLTSPSTTGLYTRAWNPKSWGAWQARCISCH